MGKYSPIGDYLRMQPGDELQLSFADVEEIIESALPASAYNHRAWWSTQQNHDSRAWAKEWMNGRVDRQQRVTDGMLGSPRQIN